MKINYLATLLLLVGCLFATQVSAQDKPEVDHSYKPLKLNLNEDGSKYVRFIMWHQIWATSNNLSNGSDFSITPSIRRSRFLAFAQISPRFLILTHWGLNGLTPDNMTSLGNNGNAPQLFLHDAWGEFKFSDEIYVGGGLHYWKGMTRMSNQSTLNMMTMDAARPFAHWHSLGNTDQFARHLGFYAKGTIAKNLQYRLAVNQRMAPDNSINGGYSYFADTGNVSSTIAMRGTGNAVIEGYFEYQFLDKESNKLPYKVGTYMGKKKIFNVGAGFYTQPNGAIDTTNSEDKTVFHVAADAFLELPTDFGAVNAYASFMNFNYGENFVGRWAGTGQNIYAQAGVFLKSANLMPYVAYQYGNYEGLEEPVTSLNIGANYYINSHFAKVTLEYHRVSQNMATFTKAAGDGDQSQIRLQLHYFL